jgi:hypothetical protein
MLSAVAIVSIVLGNQKSAGKMGPKRPGKSNSSDEEIPCDIEPEVVNRYDLDYPVLSSTALPGFKEHKFWHSIGNGPGRELLISALRARTPGGGVKKKNIGHILRNRLPYFVSSTSPRLPEPCLLLIAHQRLGISQLIYSG